MPVTDDVLDEARRWRNRGKKVAIATVVATWGSSPRPVGSQLCVDADGRFTGSVSGGCIEASVIDAALTVINDATPKLLEYAVSNEMAWEVGLSCGGRIEIFVEGLE